MDFLVLGVDPASSKWNFAVLLNQDKKLISVAKFKPEGDIMQRFQSGGAEIIRMQKEFEGRISFCVVESQYANARSNMPPAHMIPLAQFSAWVCATANALGMICYFPRPGEWSMVKKEIRWNRIEADPKTDPEILLYAKALPKGQLLDFSDSVSLTMWAVDLIKKQISQGLLTVLPQKA